MIDNLSAIRAPNKMRWRQSRQYVRYQRSAPTYESYDTLGLTVQSSKGGEGPKAPSGQDRTQYIAIHGVQLYAQGNSWRLLGPKRSPLTLCNLEVAAYRWAHHAAADLHRDAGLRPGELALAELCACQVRLTCTLHRGPALLWAPSMCGAGRRLGQHWSLLTWGTHSDPRATPQPIQLGLGLQ